MAWTDNCRFFVEPTPFRRTGPIVAYKLVQVLSSCNLLRIPICEKLLALLYKRLDSLTRSCWQGSVKDNMLGDNDRNCSCSLTRESLALYYLIACFCFKCSTWIISVSTVSFNKSSSSMVNSFSCSRLYSIVSIIFL